MRRSSRSMPGGGLRQQPGRLIDHQVSAAQIKSMPSAIMGGSISFVRPTPKSPPGRRAQAVACEPHLPPGPCYDRTPE